MIPSVFEYHAPTSLPDALRLLSELGEEAKLLAGGHSLLPMMKVRFASPSALIDLNRITVLRGIREDGDMVHIGAMTTENDLIESAVLEDRLPLLSEAARLIADPQVRNRGTIGGDIAHGDPGNDHPALAMALEATFVPREQGGQARGAGRGFFSRHLYDRSGG